jgi:3-methyl-2-oxobutanoate hydroxymethyltransferase
LNGSFRPECHPGESHSPSTCFTTRTFKDSPAAEFERLQRDRVAAFREFIADVNSGAYPQPQHAVPISDEELVKFEAAV